MGFGDGEILRVLFCNLFPKQKDRRKVYKKKNGKPVLSDSQRDLLQLAATGMPQMKIARELGCTHRNIIHQLQNIRRKLNANTLQEAVAVAISMGYLPLSVMEFIAGASGCAPKDFSTLDCLVSYTAGINDLTNVTSWQELAAFGLLLMLTAGTAIGPIWYAHSIQANGALYRLQRRIDRTYHARHIAESGLLHVPRGIAVAPPAAKRKGFQPGHVFVLHSRTTLSGMNAQEIIEFTPEGSVVRAFCGGRTVNTSLNSGGGLGFAHSGALLVTTNTSLLRFSEGGNSVENITNWCCSDIDADAEGNLYLAHYSGRGCSIGIYSRHGKLRRTVAPLPPFTNFLGLRVTTEGAMLGLQWRGADEETIMLVYDEYGTEQRCWRIPHAAHGAFALDKQKEWVYVACRDPSELLVYTLEGTLRQRIPLDSGFVPYAVTLAHDGSLWLIGSPKE